MELEKMVKMFLGVLTHICDSCLLSRITEPLQNKKKIAKIYCMRVVGIQISLRYSADCLGSLLFTFVWFACVQTGGDSE